MDRIVGWIGIVPTVGAMIAALLEMLVLAGLATAGGVALPANLTNVTTVFVVLTLGNEILRLVVVHGATASLKAEHEALRTEVVAHGGQIWVGANGLPTVVWPP